MKKSVWKSMPSYTGPRCNRKAIENLSKMCFGLAAIVSVSKPNVATVLEKLGMLLRINLSIAGKKAFIFANVIDIYKDLTDLRSVLLCYGDNVGDIEHYLNDLEAKVKTLGTFLEHEICDSPMEANMNRSVKKFIEKKAVVEIIARATKRSLNDANRELEHLKLSKVESEFEKFYKDQKIANLINFIKARERAAKALDSIIGELNELIDTARLSPGLARRINRLIHLKALADFYDKPLHAQKECEALCLHLDYLRKNQISFGTTSDWLNGMLNIYDEPIEVVNKHNETEMECLDLVVTEPKANAKKQKSNIGG